MAKIGQAKKWLEEGKKLRCNRFGSDRYIKLIKGIPCERVNADSQFIFFWDDICDETWEIYKEIYIYIPYINGIKQNIILYNLEEKDKYCKKMRKIEQYKIADISIKMIKRENLKKKNVQ